MLNKYISTFIFFICVLIGQDSKPTVAILDFEGQGVDASEVQTLSERMRTEIGNTNAVRLIERKSSYTIIRTVLHKTAEAVRSALKRVSHRTEICLRH